ncbi:iron-sulfur cluster assembly scaffold protein [Candidatus Woesearchaeota archaeon]|nr:iron-sulfur cluster assembly scaffold protein [Candidatus Woesearchaeota archaeon]
METEIQTQSKLNIHPDVKAKVESKKWFYTDTVKDHFFNPRNLLINDEEGEQYSKNADAIGMVGSPACGDALKLWLKIDKNIDKIMDCKFQTFGCASAIASTSMLSVMVTENDGMKIDDALKLKPQDIIARLGNLPSRKFHCSVLGDKALRSAINDYFRRSNQNNRIVVEGARIIDPETKTTDKDIEEAVLEGALNLEDIQKKLKVGISNKAVIPAVEELIRFYKEKYFG